MVWVERRLGVFSFPGRTGVGNESCGSGERVAAFLT